MSKLQDEIMGFLLLLQDKGLIYISNNDEASEIGSEVWMVLRGKIDE